MNSNTKIIIGISVFILILVLSGALFAMGILHLPSKINKQVEIGEIPGDKQLDSQDAVSMAQARAIQWHDDAVLAYSGTVAGKTTALGHSDSWRLIFTSPQAKEKGFEVLITDRTITSAQEIRYLGKGGQIPENLIPSQQAADYVRSLKGYENEQIISVELLYDEMAKMWFWGVKTSRGIISVKATR